ncbi:MAG TPA: histidine phosphatase family protein [Beutenbergiaceae bacterium]|nr:histidine phosphatase family protein [Beutenbergiaceae bacterium]
MPRTLVHLLRHGEVHNPAGVLYGRTPGYYLSTRGERMADRIAQVFRDRDADVAHVVASPLLRAQQTAAPLAEAYQLPIHTDARVIEARNRFEGLALSSNPGQLLNPVHWPFLINPFRPSWGEPYTSQVKRMFAAIRDAKAAAPGREAVITAHQLPIWLTRLELEGRPKFHDPRNRECALASLTTLTFDGSTLVDLHYTEPAADLIDESTASVGA